MKKFEERQWVEFFNNGAKLFGVLHKPLEVENPPAILFCHGLAGTKVGEHRMYVLLAECLAKCGIAALRFDFRGSGDSEQAFAEMSLEGEVSDTLCAAEFLCQHADVDTSRIGFFGRSFGGAIATLAAHRFGKVKTMALWAPIYDAQQWEEQWEQSQAGRMDKEKRQELMRINGQLPSFSFYEELFAMDIDQEIRSLFHIPLLLIHGEKDPRVSITHSEKYAQVRKEADVETSFIRLPHSDHDFTHPEEKLQAINITCQWFLKTL